MGSLYYRCCWHRVSNPLFSWYRQNSSHAKAVYNPKAFFLHAASLDQAFAHCRIFSTAATRRCGIRVAVSPLGAVLSHPLPVVALVSRYLTNKLIGPRPLPKRIASLILRYYLELPHLSVSYARLRGTYQGITNSFATLLHPSLRSGFRRASYPKGPLALRSLKRSEGQRSVRLACLIHAASVHPEPGSNSLKKFD